jgi:tetratricopeptide (TPR) repeat protein
MDPNAAVAANNLAWIYAEHGGSLDLALGFARTARAQMPDRHEVADTLGWIYYKRGLLPQAVEALAESVRQAPNQPVYSYHLGLAYAARGDKEKARQSLERAVSLNPSYADARNALTTLVQ